MLDEIERACDDGVNAFKSLTKDSRLVWGGGATEVEIARNVNFQELCNTLLQVN